MQWKIGHVAALIVALAVGWVAHGVVVGRGASEEQGPAVTGGSDAATSIPIGPAAVSEFVDAESTYLVVAQGTGDAGDELWLTPGRRVAAIEVGEESKTFVGRVEFQAVCPVWPECLDCRRGGNDDECPVPQPPQPDPGIALEPDELRLGVENPAK